MPPGRVRTLGGLQGRRPQLVQQGHQVGLQCEQRVIAAPVPAPGRMGGDQAGHHRRLTLRRVAAIDGADLEQGHIGEPLARVAPGRLDQVGQDRGPHAVQVRGDRVGDHQGLIAAAEQARRLARQEAPADGLGETKGRHGPPRGPHPALAHAQHAAGGAGHLGKRLDGQGAIALDAGDLFDQVGAAFDVAPPGGRGDLAALHSEAQVPQDLVDALIG